MYYSRPTAAISRELRVLIVDDHPLYGDALETALRLNNSNCSFRRAETLEATLETLKAGFDPHLIIFDLKLPDVAGISGFHELKEHKKDARVLVVSSLASTELVQSLLDAGADGFLPKDAPSETLHEAIRLVLNGGTFVPAQYARPNETAKDLHPFRSNPELSSTLTGQQMRILELICDGKPNKQIAFELSLAEATVKAHITALLRRLGVYNRTQAVVVAEAAMMRHGKGAPEAQAYLSY